jgi:cytochrome c peroxidase
MHDGSIETLEEVLDHYARGGRLIEDGPYAGDGAESPLKSGLVAGFDLSDAERSDLIAFLRSLTDDRFLTDPALSAPTP